MKVKQINIRVDQQTIEELDQLCQIHMRTRSDEMRFLIHQEREKAALRENPSEQSKEEALQQG